MHVHVYSMTDKMKVQTILVTLCLFAVIPRSQAGFAKIYSGEHLHDVLAKPGTDIAARSAVLVLYQPSCPPPFDWMDVDHQQLYLMHDYKLSKQHTWYEYRTEDDLETQYLSAESPCMSVLYFKEGNSLMTPTEIWNQKGNFKSWFWSFLKKDILVVNDYHKAVTVWQKNVRGRPLVQSVVIAPGEKSEVSTYATYSMMITGEDNITIIDATVITHNLTKFTVSEVSDVDLEAMENLDRSTQMAANYRVWGHADRHLRNLKQPLVVHNYTSDGYLKLPMPLDLFEDLNTFYQKGCDKKLDEVLDQTDEVMQNEDGRAPTMVQLTEEMIDKIANVLQPQLEEWCNTKLRKTAVYGIQEIYNGNVEPKHVDVVSTHVISVLLQIDQDNGTWKDWMMELINYNGDRQQMNLLPGEMLFLETAKLIHGWPKPFEGKKLVNAFVHFAPVAGWDYKLEGTKYSSSFFGIEENLLEMMTELTSKKKIIRKRDEL